MRRGQPKPYDLPVAALLALAAVLLCLSLPTLDLYPGAGFWVLLAVVGTMSGVAAGLLIRQLNARRGLTSEYDQSEPRVWMREWTPLLGVLTYLLVGGPWWYGLVAGLALILVVRLLMWRCWPLRPSDRLDHSEED